MSDALSSPPIAATGEPTVTEIPACPPHHRPWPPADRPVSRSGLPRRALVLRRAAWLVALATLGLQAAWARPAAARPAAAASAPVASVPPAAPSALAASTAAASPAAPAPPTRAAARFGFYGLSPAQAGQALAQAESALGQPLKLEAAAAKPPKAVAAGGASALAVVTPDCHYRSTAQQPGVRYALAGERITRIETRDPRYATVSGVHVGDSLARAQQAYGKRLASSPHPYFDQGRTLTVYSPDRRFALVMETNDSGRIITLRGGRLPEVGWLEGCS